MSWFWGWECCMGVLEKVMGHLLCYAGTLRIHFCGRSYRIFAVDNSVIGKELGRCTLECMGVGRNGSSMSD